MGELTARVKQNADGAHMAHQFATSMSSLASKGGQVVGELTGTMDAISAFSKKIVDIIGVIDAIAFQIRMACAPSSYVRQTEIEIGWRITFEG